MEIVGAVGDIKYAALDVAAEPAHYEHYNQVPWSGTYIVVVALRDH
jgi:hypothetical protein